MPDIDVALRQSIIDACRQMNAMGINQGTSGNISVREGENMLITPSATPYDAMEPEMMAAMPLEGEYGSWNGPLKPSTEWRFHLDIMRARPDVGAIVHAHPIFCTTLAICRKPIPACHYMIAAFGGTDVRCGGYARYGTAELSAYALEALEGRSACLLANHGMIACGPNLAKAMWLAVELETIAKQYYHSLSIGGPVLLSHAQIAETAAAFGSYGLQDEPKAPAQEPKALAQEPKAIAQEPEAVAAEEKPKRRAPAKASGTKTAPAKRAPAKRTPTKRASAK